MILTPALAQAAERLSAAGQSPALPGRLQTYSRFVALVAEQLDALQRKDAARLQELGEERVRLEREMAEPEAVESIRSPAANEHLGALLAAGLHELEHQTEQAQHAREVWSLLQDGALLAARDLRPAPLRSGHYQAIGITAAQVDVRF